MLPLSAAFVPIGFMQRHNQDILSNLGNTRFHIEDRHILPFPYGPSATFNTNKAFDEARDSCSNDIKSNFLHESNQVGPSAFFGMGLGGHQSGMRSGDINHLGLHAMLESSDNYRDLYSNRRDFAANSSLGSGLSGGLGQQHIYGALPDDVRRMMLMMAMGQSSGVLNNGKSTDVYFP